jgi:hypothetical protein
MAPVCQADDCTEAPHAHSLCGVHYMRMKRYGDANHVPDKVRWRDSGDALIERCKTADDALGPGECWEWTGALDPKGYGHKKRHGTNVASRVVWIEVFGPISDGLEVCHHCDNPPCVRPSHLFLGTYKDNAQDMLRKGREYREYGDRHHNIKLTDAQVAEIRALGATTSLSHRAIGEMFGVTNSHIGKILRRQARTITGDEFAAMRRAS